MKALAGFICGVAVAKKFPQWTQCISTCGQTTASVNDWHRVDIVVARRSMGDARGNALLNL